MKGHGNIKGCLSLAHAAHKADRLNLFFFRKLHNLCKYKHITESNCPLDNNFLAYPLQQNSFQTQFTTDKIKNTSKVIHVPNFAAQVLNLISWLYIQMIEIRCVLLTPLRCSLQTNQLT